MSITYAFFTSRSEKADEYREQMSRYGRDIIVLKWEGETEDENMGAIEAYLRTAPEKNRYALREESNLVVADDWDKGIETISTKTNSGEKVYNVSRLRVFTLDENGNVQKRIYRSQILGHLDLSKRSQKSEWWDDIFIPHRGHRTFTQERDFIGKTSARQHTLAQFICDFVSFKGLKDVSCNPHKPTMAVDFAPEISLEQVVRNNPFISMARLDQSPWGLGNFLIHIINGGAFFRSARSARSGNYFSPPISGIPRYMKPDPFWETTFQFHDCCHQALPDHIFSGQTSVEHRNVYTAARLMSEALTIIMADMLFIESMQDSGFEYDYNARQISPLFSSLALPQTTREKQLKALLWANVAFANLGDENPYRDMLKPNCEGQLLGYTQTYKHFFVPDLIWSVENYDDMVVRRETFSTWVSIVGRSLFARAKLPLLNDLVNNLKARGADLSTYKSSVMPVFEYLFEKMVVPKLKPVPPLPSEQSQSNAFLRYMIGQISMYAHYQHVDGMVERGNFMAQQLRECAIFTQSDISRIRAKYREDLEHLSALQIITADELGMYTQIHPIFSPHFLKYDFDNTPYGGSIPDAIKAIFE